MPIRPNTARATSTPNPIAEFAAGDVLSFTDPISRNNGFVLVVKNSKVGKNRFVNLETGRLLTSTPGDVFSKVPAGTQLTVA